MLLNYFKLSARLLIRNPFLTLINLAGLSAGLATFLLLWPLAEFELKSDQYHNDADRMVRVGVDFKWTDDNQNWNGLLGVFNWLGVAHEIEQTFPQVEDAAWLVPQAYFSHLERNTGLNASLFVSIVDATDTRKSFRETQTTFASSNLFNFFNIPLEEGDANNVLAQPNSVVLSETIAVKYFGNKRAMGQTVYLNDILPLQVTGIFKNLPHNTHLNFDMVFSAVGKDEVNTKTWNGWQGSCYFKLQAGETKESFDQALANQQQTLYDFVKTGCNHCDISAYTQPLTEIVFTNLRGNAHNYKSKYLLEALAVVAFVVLAFAWINYISLSINSLNKRLKEIGTRKCIGAKISDFFMQFFIDSVVMNVISFAIALTLVQVIGKIAEEWFQFYIPSWNEISLKTTIVILSTLGVGVLIATLYPLVLIAKRKPDELLKKLKHDIRPGTANTVLVATQYVAAIVLLIWIGAVYFQLNFIVNKDIGVKRDGLIVVEGPLNMSETNPGKINSFLNEVKRIPGVSQATASNSTIGEGEAAGLQVQAKGSTSWFGVDTNGGVDESFLDTYGIPLQAGRNFQKDNPSDRTNILVSRALSKRLGFMSPQEALGKKVLLGGNGPTRKEVEIIGVFSDYEFRPFFMDVKEEGRGIALTYKDFIIPWFKPLKFSIKIDMQNFESELESLTDLYTKTFQEPFKWFFMDEKIKMFYANEQATKNQIAFFSLLAIGIACLGLLGMISNKAVEKTKEIGIRKILGAGLLNIARLLLMTTTKQIIIANIIGIPLAYYLVTQYLQKFSERLALQWWHYAIPVLLFMIIMLVTIVSVLFKASKTNPTESLRYE